MPAMIEQAPGSVLLLGNHLPSLAAARSLTAGGYRVIAGDGGEFSTVRHSRDCAEVWDHPRISRESEFLAALLAFLGRRPDVGHILPLQERYVALLAHQRARLPKRPIIASPDPEVVLTCLDKPRLQRLAREAGVPCLPSEVAHDLPELVTAAERAGFPCIVRPAAGDAAPLPGDHKARICLDRAALAQAFPAWPEGQPSLLVQRYAPGPRHNVAFAAREGRVLARVETVVLRTDRPDGTGVGVESISVEPSPALVRACDALLADLRYTGVGVAQFLVPLGGEPHFLELLPRHATSLANAQHLGLDLAHAALELATPGGSWHMDSDFRYRAGVRFAWTTGDLHGLRRSRARGHISRSAALRWLAGSMRSAVRADMHATWSPRDPLPTLAILAQWLPIGRWKRIPLRDKPDDDLAHDGATL